MDNLLKLSEYLAPVPPVNESPFPVAKVRITHIGLNFADIFAVLGLYSATPPGTFVPGLEFAGVVEELPGGYDPEVNTSSSSPSVGEEGEGDSCGVLPLPGTEGMDSARVRERRMLKVGDEVVGVCRFGAYSSHVLADVRCLRRLPSGWSARDSVTVLCQGLTALYGLHLLGRIRKYDTVLIHSAAGGVGMHSIDLCRAAGARVICTVGHPNKKKFLLMNRPYLKPAQVSLSCTPLPPFHYCIRRLYATPTTATTTIYCRPRL